MSKESGCKYCENLFTGNTCESFITDTMTVNDIPILTTELFLADWGLEEGEASIELYQWIGDDEVTKKHVKISYCPFCGRKVGGKDD